MPARFPLPRRTAVRRRAPRPTLRRSPAPLALAALLAASAWPGLLGAQAAAPLLRAIDARVEAVTPKVVAWRRDIHEHPELSGEEVRTAKLVAEHLRALGLEVTEGIFHTGVKGVLRGAKPGPSVALRADMDALPVTEMVDLPFRSRAKATYRGQEVGVMHACGHDLHVAILMGVAEVLAGMREQLAGTVTFVFQPAEEGHPDGGGGAKPMIDAGVLKNPDVDAIFGLHVGPGPLGELRYREGPLMAASNSYSIIVRGRQAHGAIPWGGVDPIVVGSQIVTGLQTIISRQTDITAIPAIVTVGAFQGGVRNNIVPDSVVMLGTIRTFSEPQRQDIFRRVERTAMRIAESAGATAAVVIDSGYLVTTNDSALTRRMLPTMRRVAGDSLVTVAPLGTVAEDFSFFQREVPGLFFFLGVTSPDKDWRTVPTNHSPYFEADERALPVGVRALAHLTADYLAGGAK